MPDQTAVQPKLPAIADPMDNEWSYLRALAQGRVGGYPLSGLDNNLIAMEILEAARHSSRTGRAVSLDE